MRISTSGGYELTGLPGRIAGFVWGSTWTGVGVVVTTIALVRGALLPPGTERVLVELFPWLTGDFPGVLSVEAVVVGGLFGGFCSLYGLYHVGRVFFVSEYSITFSRNPERSP